MKDVFSIGEDAVRIDLVISLIQHARELKLASISTVILEGHRIVPVLVRLGFKRRPNTSTMFGYARRASPLVGAVTSRSSWQVIVGDRDV